MANKLNIYACNGVGSAESEYTYWTAGTLSQSNSQAVNNLLAKINLEYAKIVNLELTDEEALKCLDNIDLYCVCMYYAREYGNNESELHHVGQVIGELVAAGTFESNLLTDEERGVHLGELFDVVDKAMESPIKEDSVFMDWWRENVEDLNQVGLSKQQQDGITRSLIGDVIGAVDYGNADLNKYLNDAGEYFLYTYFTDAQLKKLPAVFARKARGQKQLYQYCQSLYKQMNGTTDSMDAIIESGIISTFGKTPKEVVQTLYDQYIKEGRVGALSEVLAVISAIATVLGIVVALIEKIVSAISAAKVAESKSIDQEAMDMFAPAPDDYPDDWKKQISKGGDNSVLVIGAAVIAALLLFKK